MLDAKGQLISQLSVEGCSGLIADGTIKGGMIPKMECCMQALSGGVARTHVVDGRVIHAVLLEIFSDDAGVGTLLVPWRRSPTSLQALLADLGAMASTRIGSD